MHTMTEDELNELKADYDELCRRLAAGQPIGSRNITVEDYGRIANSITQEQMAVIFDMAEEQRRGTDPRYRGKNVQRVATLLATHWIVVCSRLVEMRRPGLPYEEHVRKVMELYGSPLLGIGADNKRKRASRQRGSEGRTTAMFMVVESKQRAECFDCRLVRKIYGVQKVFSIGSSLGDDMVVRLKVPKEGSNWHWEPTCRRCAAAHLEPDGDGGGDDDEPLGEA
jgi:hypothetical protein